MINVLITCQFHENGVKKLKSKGYNVDINYDLNEEGLLEIIDKYNILIVRSNLQIDMEIINKSINLKVIARAGTGLDNIDLTSAKEKNIHVINTPSSASDSVSELVIGLIIILYRKLIESNSTLKEGIWDKKEFIWKKKLLVGSNMYGKTIGILGFGNIGKKLAIKSLALGMKVIVYDIVNIDGRFIERGIIQKNNFFEFLKELDILSIHVPLTKETEYMINSKTLKHMKKSAIIINTSRGKVLNLRDLIDSLEKTEIAGAALDVFEKEPPNPELLKHKNMIVTPHIGSQTFETHENIALNIVNKIEDIFNLQ